MFLYDRCSSFILFLIEFLLSNRKRFDLWLSIVVAYRVKESDEKRWLAVIAGRDRMFTEEAKGRVPKNKQNLSQRYRQTAARRRRRDRVLWWRARWKNYPINETEVSQFAMPWGSQWPNWTSPFKRINRLWHELGEGCIVDIQHIKNFTLLTTAHYLYEHFEILLNNLCHVELKFNLRG